MKMIGKIFVFSPQTIFNFNNTIVQLLHYVSIPNSHHLLFPWDLVKGFFFFHRFYIYGNIHNKLPLNYLFKLFKLWVIEELSLYENALALN